MPSTSAAVVRHCKYSCVLHVLLLHSAFLCYIRAASWYGERGKMSKFMVLSDALDESNRQMALHSIINKV